MSMTTLLEGTMLLCFGFAWPLASLRMLRRRRAEGRGYLPTSLVLCGYLAGMGAKLAMVEDGQDLPPIFFMYLLNACSVALNLYLQWHFNRCLGPLPDSAPASSATPGAASASPLNAVAIHQTACSPRSTVAAPLNRPV